jgi:hypothetical protein
MAIYNKVYVNDTGTKIRLNAASDISTQTVLKIDWKKPDNTEGSWDATLEGTTYACYITEDGDLDQAGIWKLQIYVEMPAWKGHGETVSMKVYEEFE